MTKAAFCGMLCVVLCAGANAQTPTEPGASSSASTTTGLKAGDRVAFFGDSITAQDLYTTFVANYYGAFRPEMKIVFKNAGVGGNVVSDGIKRIERDLVPFKPTVITCCFGMNDAGYVAPDDPKAAKNLETYKSEYRKMLEELKTKCPGARVVLLTTTAVAPINAQLLRYNETLAKFSGFVRELGKEQKLDVIELFDPMLEVVRKHTAEGHAGTVIPDGVHPNPAGQFLVAELILKAWGE